MCVLTASCEAFRYCCVCLGLDGGHIGIFVWEHLSLMQACTKRKHDAYAMLVTCVAKCVRQIFWLDGMTCVVTWELIEAWLRCAESELASKPTFVYLHWQWMGPKIEFFHFKWDNHQWSTPLICLWGGSKQLTKCKRIIFIFFFLADIGYSSSSCSILVNILNLWQRQNIPLTRFCSHGLRLLSSCHQ